MCPSIGTQPITTLTTSLLPCQIAQDRDHTAARCGFAPDAQLFVETGNPTLDGPQREDQPVRDALIGKALGHQPQHLALAAREGWWPYRLNRHRCPRKPASWNCLPSDSIDHGAVVVNTRRVTEKRDYRSPLRERQAGETRLRIVEAARDLFAENGYPATTLRAIALKAQVSPETVQAHGPKAALLRAAIELAGFGVEGLDDVAEQERAQLLFSVTPEELPAAIASLMLAIHQPIAGVYRALTGAAAGDHGVAEYQDDIVRSIRRQWTAVFKLGAERGWISDRKPIGRQVDAWCWIASPEAYLRLVIDYGWTDEQYSDWIAENFKALLIESADSGAVERRNLAQPGA